MPERLKPDFVEHLRVPWWWWPFGLVVGTLLAGELDSGQPGLRSWLPYVVGAVLVAAALLALSRPLVRVCGGELTAGVARLPLSAVGDVRALDKPAVARLLGPHSDPAAYLLTRPWIPGAVLVVLNDPADDTPYWLVSSRRPQQLAAVLERSRAAG